MAVTVAVGTHWGDEGKAKVVDFLAERHDAVVRFQGGANAGHTVIVDGEKYIFHQIPVGLMHPEKTCIIANGVAFDPMEFLKELDGHIARGIDPTNRLWISDRAAVVMPWHKRIEAIREEAAGDSAIGTTKRGIGPTYRDKISREHGIRVVDFLTPDVFREQVRAIVAEKNEVFTKIHGAEPLDANEIIADFLQAAERLRPFITNTSTLLHDMIRSGKRILCEGAQATLLDIDHGTYPFVTSSNTTAGGAVTGTGIGPTFLTDVIGIVKAYTSRVGNGPFPTEFEEEFGNEMRELWEEYGATTRRPRRCGWLDGVILRYSAGINGLTGIAITALDRLDTLPELKLCTEYWLDGKKIAGPPTRSDEFLRIECTLESFPGWQTDTTNIRRFEDLPENAQRYVHRVEEVAGIPVVLIGVGPGRDQVIKVRDLPGKTTT